MPSVFEQQDQLSPLTAALVVIVVLLLGRYLYLRSQRTADALRPPTTLPVPVAAPAASSTGRWLWAGRKERLDRQTEFVRAHVDYILARIEEAKAMGGLVRARMELADILASLETPAPALYGPAPSPAGSALTLREISEIVHALPDISPELRTILMNLLAGRLAEKIAQ